MAASLEPMEPEGIFAVGRGGRGSTDGRLKHVVELEECLFG